MSLRLAVFASGGGSNLQALIDRFPTGADSDVRVVLVVSDRPNTEALERAARVGIDAVVIPVVGRPIDLVARETLAALESADVDLIILAGYLRRVPPAVVRHYRQRMINIHPALLPAYGGQGMFGTRVHQKVIETGATVSGATVHWVDEEYDQGPIIAQWPVPVLPTDTAESLAQRVLRVEHLLLPAVVEAIGRQLERGGQPERLGPTVDSAAFQYTSTKQPDARAIRLALGLE
jgi:formyltetrahydrofolate-dependent phosphoribosylglycinamide formyltransferase